MNRKTVIVMQTPADIICRGNFKKLCDEFKLPYHSLKVRKFPIEFREAVIYRLPFK